MFLCQEQVSPVEVVLREERTHYTQEEDEEEEEEEEDEEDEDGELALWSPDIQVLELQKERDKGLGFSILDYQVRVAALTADCTGQEATSDWPTKV